MKILVFDIGGTSIKYSACVNDELLPIKETPTDAYKGGPHILDTIISLAEKETDFDAIGISTAGQVNADSGSIIYANNNIPNYTGVQLKETLEKHFHVPVSVENDVNSAAMGEAIYGAGKDYSDFLCLTYGTGVGGAIIQNKQIYHGSSFSAAEFGAIVTHSEEKIHQKDFFDGCYERYASTTALIQKMKAYNSSLVNGKIVFEHLDDPNVQKILDVWIDEIMLGLSSLTHIFNPNCIILGGGIMVQPLILEKIQAKIPKYIMPSFSHVVIKSAALGNNAGLLGAYSLAKSYLESLQQP